ncbi:MAG: hypothetical protein KatS3mg026_1261 [Bacteroidia bacterium]|nr:MAG: hypothetical protein KatS3mg026_1261 [Bacteroidia bacterium]
MKSPLSGRTFHLKLNLVDKFISEIKYSFDPTDPNQHWLIYFFRNAFWTSSYDLRKPKLHFSFDIYSLGELKDIKPATIVPLT